MKKFDLSLYFDKLCYKAEQEIENYVLTGEADSLHKLRVVLKRSDTLLLILRFADEIFDYKKYRYPLKRIFSHAGLIREAQLIQTKLEKLPAPANLTEALMRFEDIQNTERALFVYKASIYLRGIKKEHHILKSRIKHIEPNQVKMFLKYQLRRLQHKIKNKDISQLHNIRKKIKRTLYANEFLREMHSKPLLSESMVKQWDVLQDAIGQWHDHRTMLAYLKDNTYVPEVSMNEQETGLYKDSEHLLSLLNIRMKMVLPALKSQMVHVN